MRKATRASIAAQAKKVENRVSRYLWGEDHLRDWKDDNDVSGLDCTGMIWFVEVKNWAWPAGPQKLWTVLYNALDQAQGYADKWKLHNEGQAYACSVLLPLYTQDPYALVMYGDRELPRIITLEQFKKAVLRI